MGIGHSLMAHDAKGKEFYFIGIYFIVVLGFYRSNMQRVKAHELRLKDETACVEELQRHRVSNLVSKFLSMLLFPLSERTRFPPCEQGRCCPPGQARQSARRAQEHCQGPYRHHRKAQS